MIQTEEINRTFEKYQAYKDSGVEWLGEIPEEWEAVKMKFLFRDISIKNKPNEKLLSVTQNQGVVPRTWVENRMVMPSGNLESFKFIRKGDFAISLRSFEGGLEYCHHDGIISPAYTVLKKDRELIDNYYKYLFKSYSFISEIQTSVVGIREGKNISYPILSYSLLPFPSPQEQTAIATFLDDKTSKIDTAIAQKEQMIALLKERKQIIIQNAVTKGLDPNAKMKDSSVEWIGEIPERWEVSRLGLCLNPCSVKNRPDLPLLSITRELGVIVRDIEDQESNHNYIPDDLSGYKVIRKGQFGMNKMKAWQGSYGVSDYDGIISPAYYVFDLITDIKPVFFHIAIRSYIYVPFFASASDGVRIGQWDLNKSRMKEIPIIIPPNNEQLKVVEYINVQSSIIDQAITLQQSQIEKLKEYKATLIDGAVTGKIRVSG